VNFSQLKEFTYAAYRKKSWIPTLPENSSAFRQAKKNQFEIRLKDSLHSSLVFLEISVFFILCQLVYVGYLLADKMYSTLVKLTTTNNDFLDFFSKIFIFSFVYFFLYFYVFIGRFFWPVNQGATNCVTKNQRKMKYYKQLNFL
jgi:hypothetical protein